jgi:hypothetical protein
LGLQEGEKEAAYMKLFPFSLVEEANDRLKSHPNRSMTSWNDLERKFLIRFFPPTKFISKKIGITTFRQGTNESLYEALERFKALLRKFPNHNISVEELLNIFCNSLRPSVKMILDATAIESMMPHAWESSL